eukprot:scaffold393_cov158-Skeletonema_dohrnii-CCMP3373.AAC.9
MSIQGSIPLELGKLSNLMYLRLSYKSNRITKIPTIPRLSDNIHGQSTFVADCGVPSAFDEALECYNCTMCCEYYSAAAIVHFDSFDPQLLTIH